MLTKTRWFGEAWNPNLCTPETKVEPPAGEQCAFCAEAIAWTDSGVLVATLLAPGQRPMHLDCFVRSIVGGANHQQKLCGCFGGVLTSDPPSLSKRDAARVARLYFDRHRVQDVPAGE